MRTNSNNSDPRLRWRNIEIPCTKCHGTGGRWYSSTATWHGGMGGASMSWDVCDHCWGSGDENSKWTDLRALRTEEEARIAEAARTFFADGCGIGLSALHPAIEALCCVIDKEANRRKPPIKGTTYWDLYHWGVVCRTLAKTLRKLIAEKKEDSNVK